MTEPAKVAESPTDPLEATIASIAVAMRNGRMPAGDVAALRRLRPSEPGSPAFWRILTTYLQPAGLMPMGDDAERQWAVLLNALAIVNGHHAPRERLGKALAEADVSELRFTRLLRARGQQLEDAIRTTASMLASKAVAADWTEMARLLRHQDDEHGERWRRRIARSYYAALYQAKA